MSIVTKAIFWALAIILVSLAGAEGWISKGVSLAWIGTLPALAVIHLTASRRRCVA